MDVFGRQANAATLEKRGLGMSAVRRKPMRSTGNSVQD